MLRMLNRALAVGAVLLALPGVGSAEIITFENLSVDHLSDAGPLTEGSFTYQATSGPGWEVQTSFGDPPSALATFFNVEGSNAGDTVVFTRTGGGAFYFQSVDTVTALASNSDSVEITGFLGGSSVGSLVLDTSTPTDDAFVTAISPFAGPIDELRVVITRGTVQGTSNGRILDNFSLSMVPEPSSMALVGLGAAGLLGVARRRRRAA